jgi:hypothetical protein
MRVDDATFAWRCAADLLLYDADPTPRWFNIAGFVEARVVERREALIEFLPANYWCIAMPILIGSVRRASNVPVADE